MKSIGVMKEQKVDGTPEVREGTNHQKAFIGLDVPLCPEKDGEKEVFLLPPLLSKFKC